VQHWPPKNGDRFDAQFLDNVLIVIWMCHGIKTLECCLVRLKFKTFSAGVESERQSAKKQRRQIGA
jgi:hypothetical protein